MNIQHDYSDRAKKIRTGAHTKRLEAKQKQREFQSAGLAPNDWWLQNVRTKEDVIKFYEIYYPHYTPELVLAIANRIENLLHKSSQKGAQFNDDEIKYLRASAKKKVKVVATKKEEDKVETLAQIAIQDDESEESLLHKSFWYEQKQKNSHCDTIDNDGDEQFAAPWNPLHDIEREKFVGKIKLAEKRMSELLSE